MKAGKDVVLDATRDVNLIASQDTQLTTGKTAAAVAVLAWVSVWVPVARGSASRRTPTAVKGVRKATAPAE